MTTAKRPRTEAQIAAELRREESGWGKTLVRHTEESSKTLARLRRKFNASDPEIFRIALLELDAARGKRR